MTWLRKHHRRREQHQLLHLPRELRSSENGERAAEARSDQHGALARRARELRFESIEHSRQRQRREVGLVEIGTAQRDAALEEPIAEISALGRLRARREPMKVVDGHQRST